MFSILSFIQISCLGDSERSNTGSGETDDCVLYIFGMFSLFNIFVFLRLSNNKVNGRVI